MINLGKLMRVALCGVAVGLCFSTWASANDKFVFCVQRQLNEIGFNVGPSDGVIGPKTRAAIAELAKSTAPLADLASFDQSTAPQWCDSITANFPAVSSNSAVASHVQFEFGPTVQPSEKKAIMGGTFYAFALYSELFSYALDHSVTVLFGKDREWQLDRYIELKGVPASLRAKQAEPFWTSRETISGEAIGNNILITSLSDDFVNGDPQGVMELGAAGLLAHELFHIVASNLNGDAYGRDRGTLLGRIHSGPTWLNEGLAEFLQKTALDRLSSLTMDDLMASNYRYALDWQQNDAPYLSELEINPGTVTPAHYALGTLAAQRLVDTYGPETFLLYWREIGAGTDWITAFERAYGVTLDAFYDDFNAFIQRPDDPRRRNRIVVLDGPSPRLATLPELSGGNEAPRSSNPALPANAEQYFVRAQKHETGEGLIQSDDQALVWYQRAAELGHAGAIRQLALMYKDGRGIKQSAVFAAVNMKKAAELGDAEAQFLLARDHTQVPDAKVKWLQASAAQGYEPAARVLRTMGESAPSPSTQTIPTGGTADALCVQMVLYELGYAIEALSGQLDASTLQALEDYVKEHRQAHSADLINADSAAKWCLYFQTFEALEGRSKDMAELAIASWNIPIDIATAPGSLGAVMFYDADQKLLVEETSLSDGERDTAVATSVTVPYSRIADAEYICLALAEGWQLQDPSSGSSRGMCTRLRPDIWTNDGFLFLNFAAVPKPG